MLLFVLAAGGCDAFGGGSGELQRLRQENRDQRAQIEQLKKKSIEQRETIDRQTKQIAALQQLGPDRLEKLTKVDRIELGRLSGGYDDDNQPGDEGVVAYVQPIDADGHVFKAAGSILFEVFDLAATPERSLIASAALDVDNTRTAWYGDLWTNHYTVRLPWPPPDRQPPAHRDLTLRVQFTEVLTGKTFTAQKAVRITFPADAASAAK